MPIDRSLLAENQRQRDRLRRLVDRMTDADLVRPLGHGWTVADTLVHLAFWDYRAAVMIERFRQHGPAPSPSDVEVLNDSVQAMARALPPRAAARMAVEAAERVDRELATMSDDLVDAVASVGHPFSLARHVHRLEHLDEIEAALRRA